MLKIKSALLIISFLSLAVTFFPACKREIKTPLLAVAGNKPTLFKARNPEETGIYFRNDITDSGSYNIFNTLYAYNGGGVAVGDINNDGLPDLLFTGNQVAPRLYLNLGKLKFKDITKQSGIDKVFPWVTGALMTDLNNDGFLDIIISRSAGSKNDTSKTKLFFINQGNLTFRESGKELGLGSDASTIQYYPVDYDNDGDLDLYEVNHPSDFGLALNIPYYLSKEPQKDHDHFYVNEKGHYRDATDVINLTDHGFGLSAAPVDFNNDGTDEIYVANDFLEPDYFLFREKAADGHYRLANRISETTNRCTLWSMGSDIGDINHDGYMDIAVVDMDNADPIRRKTHFLPLPYGFYQLQQRNWNISQTSRNSLFINKGGKALTDISDYAGVARTDWSWSPLLEDFDQDGFLDLFISNGIKRDMNERDYAMLKFGKEDHYKFQNRRDTRTLLDSMPCSVLHNNIFKGLPDCRFEDKSVDWGMLARNTQGAAVADLDNDGDLDLIVNNTDTFAFIYENLLPESEKHYLKIFLHHPKNSFGIGTYVTCFANGVIYKKRLSTARGYQSSSEPVLLFGFPAGTKQVDSIFVQWTDGTSQKMGPQAINRTIHITWNHAPATPVRQDPPGYFQPYNGISYVHKAVPGLGFLSEKLELFSNTTCGPAFATADLTGHGTTAIIAGANNGNPPCLYYYETKTQQWICNKNSFIADATCEDAAIAILDINNDGLPDLYFASGEGSINTADRVYINKGNYQFERCKDCIEDGLSLPKCAIAVADIDGDGKQDLFVGIRTRPVDSPGVNHSYFLINKQGKLTYKSLNVPGLNTYSGEIQAAAFHDMNGDGAPDLLLAGDWMPVLLLINKRGEFNLQNDAVLNQYPGFWKALCIADVNNDGLPDIIAGNLGLNTILKATVQQPVTMLRGDFDNNGQRDAIPFHYIQNKRIPFHTRDQVCLAMPALNKVFFTNKQFATTDVYELMKQRGKDLREYAVTELRSGVFINTGTSFRFEPLPSTYQMGCINSILAADINGDKKIDYLFGGNTMDFQYEQGPINGFTPRMAPGGEFDKYIEIPLYVSPVKSMVVLPFKGKTMIGLGCQYDKSHFYLTR